MWDLREAGPTLGEGQSSMPEPADDGLVDADDGLVEADGSARAEGTTGPPPFGSEDDLARQALDYFQSTQGLCEQHAARFGNSPPRAERFDGPTFKRSLDGARAVIIDGLGTELVIDLGSAPATVYTLEGPLAVLPHDLSFGCPEGIYLGSSAS
jgi:hypothetical protein